MQSDKPCFFFFFGEGGGILVCLLEQTCLHGQVLNTLDGLCLYAVFDGNLLFFLLVPILLL